MRLALLACLTIASASPAARAADPTAVHGMLVFGTNAVFLSHLPMFHSPHDYQVLLEAGLPEAARATLAADRAASGEPVYSLVPRPFSLPLLSTGALRAFTADIYRGHFERGGTRILRGVAVRVESVLLFEKLDPSTPITKNYFGWLVRDPHPVTSAHFVLHKVDHRGTFDQVVELAGAAPGEPGERPSVQFQLIHVSLDAPIRDGQLVGTLSGRFEAVREIYLEHGDLQ